MTVTNDEIMQCMRDIFALWREGKLMTAEAIPHVQYVVGGYLVLSSGHGGGPLFASNLDAEIASDPNLAKAIDDFLNEESPEASRKMLAEGDFIARMAWVIDVLITLLVRFMREHM